LHFTRLDIATCARTSYLSLIGDLKDGPWKCSYWNTEITVLKQTVLTGKLEKIKIETSQLLFIFLSFLCALAGYKHLLIAL